MPWAHHASGRHHAGRHHALSAPGAAAEAAGRHGWRLPPDDPPAARRRARRGRADEAAAGILLLPRDGLAVGPELLGRLLLGHAEIHLNHHVVAVSQTHDASEQNRHSPQPALHDAASSADR